MKCQNMFSGKNKGTNSKCRLLNTLPRVQRLKNAFSCAEGCNNHNMIKPLTVTFKELILV